MTSQLPAINPTELSKALVRAKTRVASESETSPFLRLLKEGEWVYSADDVEVQEGSLWAINTASLSEGYAAWDEDEGTLKGESMAPMTADPVLLVELDDVGATWKKQIGFQLYCLNGEDKGTQVLYKTTSKGGLRAANKVLSEIIKQVENDPANIVPVVSLEVDSYKHKKYGKIYTPIFEVKDWIDFSGVETGETPAAETQAEPEPEKEPEPAAKPAKRKRRRIAT